MTTTCAWWLEALSLPFAAKSKGVAEAFGESAVKVQASKEALAKERVRERMVRDIAGEANRTFPDTNAPIAGTEGPGQDVPMSPQGPVRPPGARPHAGLGLRAIRRALEDSLHAAKNDATYAGEAEPTGTLVRRAAVALILREAERAGSTLELSSRGSPLPDSEILLIRRAEHELDPWSGHMALPGGRHDPTDETLLHTVERETREEVGIDLTRHAMLIGRLPEMPAIARGHQVGMTIAPFVFVVSESPPLALNYEVAEAVWASLGLLASGRVNTTVPYTRGDSLTMQFPGWDLEGRVVWGLTHRMVGMLLETTLAGGERTEGGAAP